MLVVSLGGSPSPRSRSGVLLQRSQRWLQEQGVEVVSYQVLDFPAEDLLHARFDSPKVIDLLQQIENADGLLIATPVYKASFSGALKTVLDLLPGIFAVDSQIAYGEGSAQALLAPELEERLNESLELFFSAMARRPKPIDPNLLNERLLSARWSI